MNSNSTIKIRALRRQAVRAIKVKIPLITRAHKADNKLKNKQIPNNKIIIN